MFFAIGILSWYKILYRIIGLICIPVVRAPDPLKYKCTFHITFRGKPYGLFCYPLKYQATEQKFTYAFAIAARNESAVIGQLIESIRKQTYDPSLLTVFVVADNCSDNTAEICRDMGCVVYERFCPERARKGYALEFLFDHIENDYGIQSFDGFFFFDADNLLDTRYVEEMNKAFATGQTAVVSYRNTKNFETNWVSSAYGMHFYNSTVTLHRPRSLLNIGTNITGTGFLLASTHLAGGWHYYSLTEDAELTLTLAAKGVKIAYCDTAEFFDEQPTKFRVAMRQRIRWDKGRLFNSFRRGGLPLIALFKHGMFTGYDLFFHFFPFPLIAMFNSIFVPVIMLFYGIFGAGEINVFRDFLFAYLITQAGLWLDSFSSAVLVLIREHRHIYTSKSRAMFYTFIFPWFGLIGPYSMLLALCQKVTWKPIVHTDGRRIGDIKPEEQPRSGGAVPHSPAGDC